MKLFSRKPRGAEPDAALQAFLKRLKQNDLKDEVESANWILTNGVDQGWFIRPRKEDLIVVSEAGAEKLFDVLAKRTSEEEASAEDPFPTFDYPVRSVAGEEPGYVVISQACDLIRPLKVEPFVELAYARFVEKSKEQKVIDQAKASFRLVLLAETAKGAWVVDLRRRVLLPKDLLRHQAPSAYTFANERDRRRFQLRMGQRYHRTAVPSDLVETLQRPLRDRLKKTAKARGHAAKFSEWIGLREDDKIRVSAIVGYGTTQREADDAWRWLFDGLPDPVRNLIHHESGAVLPTSINWWYWLTSFKLDLDEVTFSGKAPPDGALPNY